jgi:hypothetical protein
MPKSKPQQLNPAILEAALDGLEIQRKRLDEQIGQVRALLRRRTPGRPARSTDSDSEQQARPKRRKMSAAARKRIGLVQKRRWAEFRARQSGKKSGR